VQKRFIDYAADMGWRYTLIDALWDEQIGYERLEELVDYARSKNVKILVWYNSAGDWNTAPQTPRDVTLNLAALGIKQGATAITDGEGGNLSFREQRVELDANQQAKLNLRPRGGFVMVVPQ